MKNLQNTGDIGIMQLLHPDALRFFPIVLRLSSRELYFRAGGELHTYIIMMHMYVMIDRLDLANRSGT